MVFPRSHTEQGIQLRSLWFAVLVLPFAIWNKIINTDKILVLHENVPFTNFCYPDHLNSSLRTVL